MPEFKGRLRTPTLAAAPGSPSTGELYYDTVTNILYYWNGTAWVSGGGGAGGDTEEWISGSAPPTAGIGTDGDWYLQTTGSPAYRPIYIDGGDGGVIPKGEVKGQVLIYRRSSDLQYWQFVWDGSVSWWYIGGPWELTSFSFTVGPQNITSTTWINFSMGSGNMDYFLPYQGDWNYKIVIPPGTKQSLAGGFLYMGVQNKTGNPAAGDTVRTQADTAGGDVAPVVYEDGIYGGNANDRMRMMCRVSAGTATVFSDQTNVYALPQLYWQPQRIIIL